MSFIRRAGTAVFTALPALPFFLPVIAIESLRREYYWISILAGASALLGSALVLGFLQPRGVRAHWAWILAAGLAAMGLALTATAAVNLTPLCVGQNNGDGNNDLGRCLGYVLLYAVFYGIPYLLMLAASAGIGHWALKFLDTTTKKK
ncbi:MAG: hypothetical protein ACOY0R_04590 [Chloroflexota bacterium]